MKSRLELVPHLDHTTPNIVLREIAESHNIPFVVSENVKLFVQEIENNPIVSQDEFEQMARYVNPHEEWNIDRLRDAYDFLLTWEKNRPRRIPESNFLCGPQTNHDPEKLNACVLYAICIRYGVPLTPDTTLQQMGIICKMIFNDAEYARSIVNNSINYIPKQELIKLYQQACKHIIDPPQDIDNYVQESCNYDSLERAVSTFSSKKDLLMIIDPRNYAEAVALAAVNFDIDLSSAENPISEYKLLRLSDTDYIPRDENVRVIYDLNPRLLDLTENFNPMLPPEFYSSATLEDMASIEGFSNQDIRSETAYTLLQTVYMSFTFYHGKQPGMKNSDTHFSYEEIQELDNNLIVCYGVQGAFGSMTAFKYSELAQLFDEYKNFVNPIDKSIFDKNAIVKLKNLCKLIRVGESQQSKDDREELHKAIIHTELFVDETHVKSKNLYQTFRDCDSAKQQEIKDVINSLFHLSMYMRGWTGEGVFPIDRAPVDNQTLVDLNVTASIIDFETKCQDLGEIGNQILDLPLLKISGGEFQPVASEESGKTIRGRLHIVKSGDDHVTYDSCIRLSSNLLAITCWRYMEVLGMSTPFDIERLREIS